MTVGFGVHFCHQNIDCLTLCAKTQLNVVKNVVKMLQKCCEYHNVVRTYCNVVKNVVKLSVPVGQGKNNNNMDMTISRESCCWGFRTLKRRVI